MKIFLTGFMGVGKSTIAKEVASLLNIEFLDLDDYIADQEKKSIPELFSTGESSFRAIESKYLAKLIKTSAEHCVIALGGGTSCSKPNSDLILSNGLMVYLVKTKQELLDDLPYLRESRPLFQGLNDEEATNTLMRLFEQREAYYRKSQLEMPVNTGFLPKKLANILKLLTNRPQSL